MSTLSLLHKVIGRGLVMVLVCLSAAISVADADQYATAKELALMEGFPPPPEEYFEGEQGRSPFLVG